MITLLIVIVLVLLIFGGLPGVGYSHPYGYGPAGILSVLLVVFLILTLTGHVSL